MNQESSALFLGEFLSCQRRSECIHTLVTVIRVIFHCPEPPLMDYSETTWHF